MRTSKARPDQTGLSVSQALELYGYFCRHTPEVEPRAESRTHGSVRGWREVSRVPTVNDAV